MVQGLGALHTAVQIDLLHQKLQTEQQTVQRLSAQPKVAGVTHIAGTTGTSAAGQIVDAYA
ncbi:hypothetical protein [Alicyclobacillus sp. SP_1]|jgi:hypothetical protein|uniref:hypothetical protein n=1 Tax=Alicyclobacillus sp. SP_1 TaxID=2942475 RepID=UPI002157F67B|nr:hypothetical protein [Alicyclobacillus sp. SP_1]